MKKFSTLVAFTLTLSLFLVSCKEAVEKKQNTTNTEEIKEPKKSAPVVVLNANLATESDLVALGFSAEVVNKLLAARPFLSMSDFTAIIEEENTAALFKKIFVPLNLNTTEEKAFKIIPGVIQALRTLQSYGYLLIIITNQSGIGRGYYSEENFNHLMTWVKDEFRLQNGDIDAIYFCPHHSIYGKGKYMVNCECRKPKPGMLIKAIKDLNIDPQKYQLWLPYRLFLYDFFHKHYKSKLFQI